MSDTRFCPTCGYELPGTARFCGECGTALEALAEPTPPTRPVVEPSRPAQPAQTGTAASSFRWSAAVAIGLVVVGLAVGAVVVFSGSDDPVTTSGTNATSTAPTTSTPVPTTAPLATTTTTEPAAALPDPIAAIIDGATIRMEPDLRLDAVLLTAHPGGTETGDGLRVDSSTGGALAFEEGLFPGTALVFEVAYDGDAGFHAVLESGEFKAEGYRRFGLRIEPDDVLVNEWWEDDAITNFDPVDSTVRTEAGEFFHLLIGVDTDNVFRFAILTPGLVTAIRSDGMFGADWEREAWNLYLAADRGSFTVRHAWIVEFDRFVG